MINYTFYLGEFNGYSYVGSTKDYPKRTRDHFYNRYNENAPKHNYDFPDEDEEILRRHVEEMENTFIRMFNTTLNKIMPLGNSFNKYEE